MSDDVEIKKEQLKTLKERRVKAAEMGGSDRVATQKKKGKLKIDDWIHCLTSEGIPAEVIAEVTGIDPPSNLHSKIAE
ncbi:MAG: hypothetical protein QF369_03415 [Dehalococcoidales bacterium]|nr:hypothetical protein [Dehalococcoidales bacterium]